MFLPFCQILLSSFACLNIICLQNPNALDSKVLLDFDHVKNSLKVDDEGKLKILFLKISFRVFLPFYHCNLFSFSSQS